MQETYTVIVAGEYWDMIHEKARAIDTARRCLLTHDNVVVKDKDGKTIYQHRRPKAIAGESYDIK